MSDFVTIGGVQVDVNKPCDVLRELRKAELTIATGESVAMTRFENDEVRFSAASSAALEKLIARYEALCARAQGRGVRRTKIVAWRP